MAGSQSVLDNDVTLSISVGQSCNIKLSKRFVCRWQGGKVVKELRLCENRSEDLRRTAKDYWIVSRGHGELVDSQLFFGLSVYRRSCHVDTGDIGAANLLLESPTPTGCAVGPGVCRSHINSELFDIAENSKRIQNITTSWYV